jgi:hypothetical protein
VTQLFNLDRRSVLHVVWHRCRAVVEIPTYGFPPRPPQKIKGLPIWQPFRSLRLWELLRAAKRGPAHRRISAREVLGVGSSLRVRISR